MIKHKVEIIGLPEDIIKESQIEVELEAGAGLGDLIASIKQKKPGLEGKVIVPGENKLTRYYIFHINGRLHLNDSKVKIQDGDRIILLTLPLGG